MSKTDVPSNESGQEQYAYRRFGSGSGLPLLCLQHFTGTLDNWDPAVVDPLARGREVILFESAGVGRSSGTVPETMAGMAQHALTFLDALGIRKVDILGFSLGGMVASLAKPLNDPLLQGYAVFQKIFFAPTASSQAAGAAFIDRLMQRREDRESVSGPAVAQAQMAAFREWSVPRWSASRTCDVSIIPRLSSMVCTTTWFRSETPIA